MKLYAGLIVAVLNFLRLSDEITEHGKKLQEDESPALHTRLGKHLALSASAI